MRSRPIKVFKRGARYYFRKRVPTRYRKLEPLAEIWRPLAARSERAAEREASRIWTGLIGQWERVRLGVDGDPFLEKRQATELAVRLGYSYLSVEKVAKLPIEELLDRCELTFAEPALVEERAKALLGGAKNPDPTPSVLLAVYFADNEYKLLGRSEAQTAIWRQNRIRSMNMLTDFFGDDRLDLLSNDDLLELRASLWGRVTAGRMQPSTANALMEYADQVLDHCRRLRGFKFEASFRHLRFHEPSRSRGVTFSTDWIRDTLIATPALQNLGPQARAILLGMINTGYRLSEGANLLPKDIHLDCDIPHLVIQPEDRRLKTIYSRREIPLVGVSLEAFLAFPNGFPDYRDRRSLSQKLNRYLRANGLLESAKHSVKSLRHALSDRLVEVEAPDRVIRTIMGHKIPGTAYGRGSSLELKLTYLSKIAL